MSNSSTEQGRPTDSQDVTLSAGDLATVRRALADAAEYRRYRDPYCANCIDHPGKVCAGHEADEDQAGAYDELAARLGKDRKPGTDPRSWVLEAELGRAYNYLHTVRGMELDYA